jgi:hypothetical protein
MALDAVIAEMLPVKSETKTYKAVLMDAQI